MKVMIEKKDCNGVVVCATMQKSCNVECEELISAYATANVECSDRRISSY